jgi:cytochrome c-550 PedF
MHRRLTILLACTTIASVFMIEHQALGHGDVVPQPVVTTGLEPLGADWREENPYRKNAKAIEIGSSGYNQNCARCHGLEVISGGIAPDLRYLDLGKEGDTGSYNGFVTGLRTTARLRCPPSKAFSARKLSGR